MKIKPINLAKAAAVVIGVVSLCSCGGIPPADYVASGFVPSEVTHVAVLPTVDGRVDRSKDLNLDSHVQGAVKTVLKKRGYSYTVHTDRAMVSSIPRSELSQPSAAWIGNLPPKDDRWVLMMVLNDSASRLTFGSTGNAEMQGFLFDKKTRSVLWREQAVGQTGQGGLIGMAMIGMMESAAIESAAAQTIHSIPKRQ